MSLDPVSQWSLTFLLGFYKRINLCVVSDNGAWLLFYDFFLNFTVFVFGKLFLKIYFCIWYAWFSIIIENNNAQTFGESQKDLIL